MVDWLAGKRVRGTSSERTPLGVTLGGTGVGGWVELGRTTLGSAGDSIDVTSLADKRYYMVLDYSLASSTIDSYTQINGDTGSNYSQRRSIDGGTDTTNTSLTYQDAVFSSGVAVPHFGVRYIANYASKEKLTIGHYVRQNTAGAANAPNRTEIVSKWANTSNAINRINTQNSSGGSFATGSEVVVLGWDPADSHTNNFWEELASATGTSCASMSFTAKKYLWIQGYMETDTGAIGMRFGNSTLDSGSNYAQRYQSNGAADATDVNVSNDGTWTATTPIFYNIFMINNASNEKLILTHLARQSTAGATTAPLRVESAWKWVNTSNQADILGFIATTGTLQSNCVAKVWGAD